MTKFAQRLVEAMARKNMTVVQLAEHINIANSCVYGYLQKGVLPNAYTLGCIADTLGVSMDWLWGRVEE